MPHFYSLNVEPHDITRVFANFLEFRIDYSKPVGPDNGSWTLVRNWGWGVSGTYWGSFALLRTVTTLSNGRTYALLRNFSPARMEVVELPAADQNLRFTGIQTGDTSFSIDPDGTLRTLIKCDIPYNVVGSRIVWKKRSLSGFDPSTNNPRWAFPSTVLTSPTLTREDVCVALRVVRPWEITSSGIVLAFGDLNTSGYHLQGLDLSTGQWKWKAAQSTHPNYIGPLPDDGHFDIGNNWFSDYAGGGHHAIGRHIFWQYHGEGWKQGQTNKWTHLHDNGLLIGQFGVVSRAAGAWLPEAPAGMAGNAFASAVVPAADGGFYIYHNYESQHGGIHRWHVTGLDTIREEVQSITLSKSLQTGLQATTTTAWGSTPCVP